MIFFQSLAAKMNYFSFYRGLTYLCLFSIILKIFQAYAEEFQQCSDYSSVSDDDYW